LLSLGVYAFCGRYFSRYKAILAATIFFATPAIFTQAGYAYIDITIALYAFMSIYLFLIWRDTGKFIDLFLSGIFCGACMSIKYLGSYVYICMAAVFFYNWIYGRKKGTLRAFFIFSVIAGAVACVWYLRSYLITGNPFYPFFHQYFKNAWDNPMSVACGTAKNLKNLVLLPWNITMHPLIFGGESIGIVYLMVLPFIFLWDGLKDFKVRAMSLFVIIFTLMWFATFQATRYLFAVLPVLAIMGSASMTDVSKNYRSRKIVILILSLSLLLNCAVSLYHAKDSIRVVLGLESKESYLARKERSFSACDYINKNTELDSKILTTDPRIYYCDRNIIYSGYYLACKGIKDNISIKEMASILKKDNFTHLLLVLPRPFDRRDKDISSAPVTIIHQNYFMENTPEDSRYILLKL
jgi:4-amino-4-deoxy-L-arabinose transferase-like glycosyltransferase